MSTRLVRVQKELKMLEKDPPPGVSCWPKSEDQIFELEAGRNITLCSSDIYFAFNHVIYCF